MSVLSRGRKYIKQSFASHIHIVPHFHYFYLFIFENDGIPKRYFYLYGRVTQRTHEPNLKGRREKQCVRTLTSGAFRKHSEKTTASWSLTLNAASTVISKTASMSRSAVSAGLLKTVGNVERTPEAIAEATDALKDYAEGLIARGYDTRERLWNLKYPETDRAAQNS